MKKAVFITCIVVLFAFLFGHMHINIFPQTTEQPKTLEQFKQLVGNDEYAELTAEPTDDNDAVDIGYLKTNNYVALPAWTAEDAGKVLTVGADGTLTWATPSAST